MRRSILTLATISVLALGACSSGDATDSSTTPAASSSSDPLQASPSDAAEASADAAKESAANEAPAAEEPSAGTASEAEGEDGGMPGGGSGDEEFTTKGYLEDMWALAEEEDDGSTGMTCLVFRAEPDAELELGEDALIDSIEAEVEGIDREEARTFFDKKCPTADEIEAASEGDAQ